MIVLIDNYDSFTYNLVQRIGELDPTREVRVFRNDRTTPDELEALAPTHVIVSPGPCTPSEAGISKDVIARFAGKVPVLGVCLGHQCLGELYGGKVVRAGRVMHGKTCPIRHDDVGVHAGLSQPFVATRYHSLIVDVAGISADFVVSAWTDEGEVMGLRHRTLPLEGVQYHPESFLTDEGPTLLANFLGM